MRPRNLNEVIGQKKVKGVLSKLIESAQIRNDAIPHILLTGPAGTGKTTLANVIGEECNTKVYIANGGNISNPKSILPYLSRIKRNQILFIDEVHRVKPNIQELLYTVLEDFRLDIGKKAKVNIKYDPFTVIGATTDSGLMLKPFRDRFVYNLTLESYNREDMQKIVIAYSLKFGLALSDVSANELSQRCRGTPRLAVNYLKWLRDYCITENITHPDVNCINKAMLIIGVDKDGMTDTDRRYIETLRRFGKPVGLKTISSAINIDEKTVESVIEPLLLQRNIILKTNRGRELNNDNHEGQA